MAGKLEGNGVVVRSVGVKDVILPGEMKVILNQVVEAEKIAQANLIRRREETAATRSLLNTARLMDDNPTLLRLKELETLEKVTEKIDKLTVFGGLEGVLKDVVRIPRALHRGRAQRPGARHLSPLLHVGNRIKPVAAPDAPAQRRSLF